MQGKTESDPECSQWVDVPHDITMCCDPLSTRYALSRIGVRPAADGKVYLEATNTRVAVICEARGRIETHVCVPGHMMKAKKLRSRRASVSRHRVRLVNGEWRIPAKLPGNSEQIELTAKKSDERFPDMTRVVMSDIPGTATVVSINAGLLKALASAVNGSSHDNVTLFICPDSNGQVTTAIGVLGECGFGVLMPLGDEGQTPESNRRRWRVAVADYLKCTSGSRVDKPKSAQASTEPPATEPPATEAENSPAATTARRPKRRASKAGAK